MSFNALGSVLTGALLKIVISKPNKNTEYKKITITKTDTGYIAEKLTQKQAFHENLSQDKLFEYCTQLLQSGFSQLNAWDNTHEYSALISKKGAVSLKKVNAPQQSEHAPRPHHNRQKNYILREGMQIPALIDMGVFTKDGKIVSSMYDKYKQINRFIEIIDDEVSNGAQPLNIIDFGCGKSYLTFIVYYYFTNIKHREVNITGLDLKAEVIEKCNKAAERYGYKGLKFEVGDIGGYEINKRIDMVLTLHACDTATDYALFNAVQWGAKTIFSVPCCQHELNEQIKTQSLAALTRYGIIKERFSALATDAIRANLLTAAGYKTQVLEFVDLSHTPKNLLLRAVRSNISQKAKATALAEAKALMQEFSFNPTFYSLLNNAGLICQ